MVILRSYASQLGLSPLHHMEKGCQSVHWLHRGCVDIRHLHYYGRHTTENQSGRCRLNKGNFSTVLPHAALKYRAYFSAYLILVHCSICCKNAGGIDSWAIKTFRRRLWKRKVKALLYYLNGAEVFNQIACLVRSMERFYELSWLLFVFFLNVRIWRRIWIELIRNFTVISTTTRIIYRLTFPCC